MDEEQKLGWVDLQILAILVKNFSKFYDNYPVIGIDSSSVHIRTDELLRLAEFYSLDVEFKVYNHPDGSIYHCHKITASGVDFVSQKTVKEADNG
jgi:hypothetical protein